MISAVVFAGCDFSKNETTKPFENPYAEIGKVHNQALGYVLADLEKLREPVTERKAFFDAAETSVQGFFKERGIEERKLKGIEWSRELVQGATQRRTTAQSGSASEANTSSGLETSLLPDSVLSKLTFKQKQYIEEIATLVDSSSSISEFEDSLAALSQSALGELGKEDAAVVLMASAVAKSSYAYWSKHFGEWREAVHARLPKADSVVVSHGDTTTRSTVAASQSVATANSGGCGTGKHRQLKSIDEVHFSDGSSATVYHYDCVSNEGGGEGLGGSVADVVKADGAGTVAGALLGAAPVVIDEVTVPAGAAAGAISFSGAAGINEVYEWVGWEKDH